ncbi:MAG: hypothetical protein JOZ51_21455 [Chloroflexi bacterium]|nr:hypothetical protein [Chloroflexota bacterium]
MTWTENLLLCVAIILGVAAALALLFSWLSAIVLLLAAVAIVALVRERVTYRQTLQALAEQLDDLDTLAKLEVNTSKSAALIDQALNRAIQRSREQSRHALFSQPALHVIPPAVTDAPMTVAVLSIDLRRAESELYTSAYAEYLAAVADAAVQATRQTSALLQAQGDGTLLLIFGVLPDQPVALSLRQAQNTALTLASSFPELRFGLSCGSARLCPLPGVGQMMVGAPLEDAVRLSRMAASWHEYNLLCTEPTALLARMVPSHRTPLQFTHTAMPTLPVYALELDSAVAMSA